jgi:hypothetical protein
MNEFTRAVPIPKPWFILDRVIPYSDYEISRIEKFVRWLSVEESDATAENVEVLSWHNARSLVCAHDWDPRFGE